MSSLLLRLLSEGEKKKNEKGIQERGKKKERRKREGLKKKSPFLRKGRGKRGKIDLVRFPSLISGTSFSLSAPRKK